MLELVFNKSKVSKGGAGMQQDVRSRAEATGSDSTPPEISDNLTDGVPTLTSEKSVRRWAREKPDEPAFVGPQASLTWAQLDVAADRCAAYLRDLGVGPHSRIGWLGHNDIAYPVLLVAARRRRAALAGLNWRLTADELRQTIDAVIPGVIVADHHTTSLLHSAGAPESTEVVALTSSSVFPWDDTAVDPTADLSDDAIGAGPGGTEEIALFWYTSGSTGAPKAVALGADRNELQVAFPMPFIVPDGSRFLVIPPVFHIAGSVWVQYGLTRGAAVYFTDDSTPAGIVRALSDNRITHALMVPALLTVLVAELRVRPQPLFLDYILYGTSPIAPDLLRDCIELLGCRFGQIYGLTEAGGVVCGLTDSERHLTGPHAGRLLSTGQALPGSGVEMRVAGAGDADAAADADEVGELYLRTPTLMLGYWRDGAPLGPVRETDEWLGTGDLARIDDDGFVYIVGRADDMIITGGENVQPGEVEAVIARMDGISEYAVFGKDHPKWGQSVAAAVVTTTSVDPADVIAFCRNNLAHYKCPTEVYVLDELPRTATGKILRGRLRDHVS